MTRPNALLAVSVVSLSLDQKCYFVFSVAGLCPDQKHYRRGNWGEPAAIIISAAAAAARCSSSSQMGRSQSKHSAESD